MNMIKIKNVSYSQNLDLNKCLGDSIELARKIAEEKEKALVLQKAKEKAEGGFHERPDGCKRFFRSGRSGEGREQLTPDQVERLETGFKDVLQRFGY